MKDASEMLAEMRSEWKFPLLTDDFEPRIKSVLNIIRVYSGQMVKDVREAEDVANGEQVAGKANDMALEAAVRRVEADPNVDQWEKEVLSEIFQTENSVFNLANLARHIRFAENSEGKRVLEGRFLDLYSIGPVLSRCMKDAGIAKPVFFACISTVYQEAVIVGVGPRDWTYKDIRLIAVNPETELLKMVGQISGEEEAEKFVDSASEYFRTKIQSASEAPSQR